MEADTGNKKLVVQTLQASITSELLYSKKLTRPISLDKAEYFYPAQAFDWEKIQGADGNDVVTRVAVNDAYREKEWDKENTIDRRVQLFVEVNRQGAVADAALEVVYDLSGILGVRAVVRQGKKKLDKCKAELLTAVKDWGAEKEKTVDS